MRLTGPSGPGPSSEHPLIRLYGTLRWTLGVKTRPAPSPRQSGGLAVLAQALGNLFIVVELLGAAYLIWLVVSLWRNPTKADLG